MKHWREVDGVQHIVMWQNNGWVPVCAAIGEESVTVPALQQFDPPYCQACLTRQYEQGKRSKEDSTW